MVLPVAGFDDFDIKDKIIRENYFPEDLYDILDASPEIEQRYHTYADEFRYIERLPSMNTDVIDNIIHHNMLYSPLSSEDCSPTDQLVVYLIQLLQHPTKEIMDKIIEMTEWILDKLTKNQSLLVANNLAKKYIESFFIHLCEYLFEHNNLVEWQYDDEEFAHILDTLNDLEDQDVLTSINDKVKNIDQEYKRNKFSDCSQKSEALEKIYSVRHTRYQDKKIITKYYNVLMKYFVTIVEQESYSEVCDVHNLMETYSQLMKTRKILDYL